MTSERAGASTLREGRRRTWAVLRRPRIALAGLVTTVLFVLLELAFFIGTKAAGLDISDQVAAFFLGATVASVPWALWTVGLTMGGGASWAAGGAMEEQTGRVLAELGRDWVIFNNVPFLDRRGGWRGTVDVDHIAVGPSGVLVVETKYASDDRDISRTNRAQAKAIRQVKDNKGRVTGLLRSSAPDLPIFPLVVWWGPKLTGATDIVSKAGDVLVVRGGDSTEWLPLLSGPALPKESIRRAVERIEKHQREHVNGQR
jgi:hypothetical protein